MSTDATHNTEPTPGRPYAGLWERIKDAPASDVPPTADLREATWPPLDWDQDLERAWTNLKAKRYQAELQVDRAREAARPTRAFGFTTIASQRTRQRLADAEARYQRLLRMERELGQYRPRRPFFLGRALKKGPVPARRPSILD